MWSSWITRSRNIVLDVKKWIKKINKCEGKTSVVHGHPTILEPNWCAHQTQKCVGRKNNCTI